MVKKIIESNYILYIIASIIPFLTISIFIADLIYSSVAILFLIHIMKNNYRLDYKKFFFLSLITFYFVCVLSSILSDNIFFSLKSSLSLIRVFLFIFLLSYLINLKKNLTDIFYNFFQVTFLVLVLYGFFQYVIEYTNLDNLERLKLEGVRLTLLFSDEEKLGSFLIRLYGLFLALHITKKNKSHFNNIFFIILSIFCFIVVLLSGERTSVFFMIMLFFICLVLLNIRFKVKLISFTLIIISFFILLSFNSNLSNRFLFDKNNQFNISKDEIIVFTPQHTAHYKAAAKMFLDKPYLGHGPKMFRNLCYDIKYESRIGAYKSCSSHPHNTYLQLLAETGLAGTLIFSLGFFHVFFVLTKHFFYVLLSRKERLSNYQVVLSATVLITFWPFSPAGNVFNNWLLIVYSLPLSFYFEEFFKNKKLDKF